MLRHGRSKRVSNHIWYGQSGAIPHLGFPNLSGTSQESSSVGLTGSIDCKANSCTPAQQAIDIGGALSASLRFFQSYRTSFSDMQVVAEHSLVLSPSGLVFMGHPMG